MKSNKGYYAALCVCLAVLVVGGLSFGMSGKRETKSGQKPAAEQGTTMKPVNVNQAADLETSMAQREEYLASQQDAQENNSQNKTESSSSAKAGGTEVKSTEPKPKAAASNTAPAKQTAPKEEDGTASAELSFSTPLDGDIVMDFSMEHGIYDATLEQYRTNNCVSIAGEKGEKVKAAEDGTVKEVMNDDERGKTISILHENGWETTYSQLQDDVSVKKGDKVKKGQEIGSISEPTKYGSALGDHLDFALLKDGQYVDPKTILGE